MTGRIEENEETVCGLLTFGSRRTERVPSLLRLGEVIDIKINVGLLRYRALRPRRRHIVVDPHGGEQQVIELYNSHFLRGGDDFSTQKFGPKCAQLARVGTVQRDSPQTYLRHFRDLTSPPWIGSIDGVHCGRCGCNALKMSAGSDIRIERFNPAMQDAFRTLVLNGMAERWGVVDESLNADLNDIDTHYDNDCVLVAVDGAMVVGTGILLIREAEGEIVRMSTLRDYRRRGIARHILAQLVRVAAEYGVKRIVVETNAKWIEARKLYEAFGFTFTHSTPGAFGRETFYELLI
jgi:GNAT superfamily N-acetyltransferase